MINALLFSYQVIDHEQENSRVLKQFMQTLGEVLPPKPPFNEKKRVFLIMIR